MEGNAILQLLTFPSVLMFTWFCGRIQKMRRPGAFFAAFCLYQVLVMAFRVAMPSITQTSAYPLLAMSGLAIIPILFSAEPFKIRILKNLVFIVIYMFTDMLVGLCYSLVSGGTVLPTAIDDSAVSLFVMTYAVAYPCLAAILLLALPLIARLSSTESSGVPVFPFAGILFSQAALMMLVRYTWLQDPEGMLTDISVPFRVILIAFTLAWIAVDIVFFVKIEHDARIQKRLAQQRDLELYQRGVAQVHERFSLQNRLLHGLRHDLANHIVSVHAAMQEERKDDALRSIATLRRLVEEWSSEEDADAIPLTQLPKSLAGGLSDSIPEHSRAGVVYGVLSCLFLVAYCFCYGISAATGDIQLVQLTLIVAVLAASFAAHVVCIRWLRSIEEKRARAFDGAAMNQLMLATAQMEQACQTLKNEKESLAFKLRVALDEAACGIESFDSVRTEAHMRKGLSAVDGVLPKRTNNATLDGILLAKSMQCAEDGMRLTVQAQLPERTPLSDLELASIAFNLLDNAIAGVRAARVAGREEAFEISFIAKAQAGQLLIATSNSCDPSLKGKAIKSAYYAADGSKHGLGTQILTALAERHDGIADFRALDGEFTARVMIPLEGL